MVGVVVVTHGDFGRELVRSVEMILGKQEKIVPVTLVPGDSPESLGEKMLAAIRQVENSAGTLVLTDLVGGTPANVTASLGRDHAIECLAGLNMPMLLQVLIARQNGASLEELADLGAQSGRDGVVKLCRLLRERNGEDTGKR
jgi:PTS system mannose-specific IIA component